MAHAKAHKPNTDFRPVAPAGQQPVLGTEELVFAPLPDLKALEQVGGPELDGALELPTRTVWSSRMSANLDE